MSGDFYKKCLGPGILLGIIVSLVGVIYAHQKDLNCHHADLIQTLQSEKVDNRTMQMVIDQQTKVIDMQQKNFDRLYEEIKDLRKEMSTFVIN